MKKYSKQKKKTLSSRLNIIQKAKNSEMHILLDEIISFMEHYTNE